MEKLTEFELQAILRAYIVEIRFASTRLDIKDKEGDNATMLKRIISLCDNYLEIRETHRD